MSLPSRRQHASTPAASLRARLCQGCWLNNGYAYRARVIETDELVQASWDRCYVEACVKRHAEMGLPT